VRLKNQRGAAAVEFAIILLPLILVLFGIIDFSWFFWNKHVVTDAAREGARWAVLPGMTDPEVRSVITGKVTSLLYVAPGSIVISPNPIIMTPDAPVTVSVTVPFSFFVLPDFIAGAENHTSITSSVVMKHEH
jgi:hypothetical protein